MNKAIFFDRDGTLNIDEGFTYETDRLVFFPDVTAALKLLKNDFKLFIVTNQSGIGQGHYTLEDAERFNEHLLNELENEDIHIEKVYVCPHAPDKGCECRKPKIKFLKEAEKEFDIKLKESYFIGDRERDVETGNNAGAKGILVLTGNGEDELKSISIKPDFIAKDLSDAARWILNSQ